MTARSIKEHLNGREDVRSRVFRGRIVPMVHKVPLECSEEAFVIVIVPAVAISAHVGGDTALVEQALIARGRILTAAIRVVWELCHWVAVRQRHDEGHARPDPRSDGGSFLATSNRYWDCLEARHFYAVVARMPSWRISWAMRCSPAGCPCLTGHHRCWDCRRSCGTLDRSPGCLSVRCISRIGSRRSCSWIARDLMGTSSRSTPSML